MDKQSAVHSKKCPHKTSTVHPSPPQSLTLASWTVPVCCVRTEEEAAAQWPPAQLHTISTQRNLICPLPRGNMPGTHPLARTQSLSLSLSSLLSSLSHTREHIDFDIDTNTWVHISNSQITSFAKTDQKRMFCMYEARWCKFSFMTSDHISMTVIQTHA